MSIKNLTLGFVGAGNMAQALGRGLIAKVFSPFPDGTASSSSNKLERLTGPDIIAPDQIWASAPQDGTLSIWKEWGAHATHTNRELFEKCDVVILAVKPGLFPRAVLSSRESTRIKCKLVVSVMSGITIDTLETELGTHIGVPVVRVMPNTCAMVGAGCAAFSRGKGVTDEHCRIVETMFEAVGLCEEVPESQINAFCGLIGSGPAYIYTVIEALSDGAVKMGIERSVATRFAAQLASGSAQMVLQTGRHPASLRDDVCSPGGTTIAAMHRLEKGGIRAGLMDAVEAATLRAEEQGKKC